MFGSPASSAPGSASPPGTGLELLETQLVTAADVTQLDFATVLDGDSDGEYVLESLWYPPSVSATNLQVLMNGTLWTAVTGFYYWRDTVNSENDQPVAMVGRTGYTDDQPHFIISRMALKTGTKRMIRTTDYFSSPTEKYQAYNRVSIIDDTATNVVSMGLLSTTASGIKIGSEFRLYRAGTPYA